MFTVTHDLQAAPYTTPCERRRSSVNMTNIDDLREQWRKGCHSRQLSQETVGVDPLVGMFPFFERMSKKARLPVSFPETVVYEHAFPKGWYWLEPSSKPRPSTKKLLSLLESPLACAEDDNRTIEDDCLRTVKSKGCESSVIYDSFRRVEKGNTSGIVAQLVRRAEPDSISVEYLTLQGLTQFLLNLPDQGIISRFIPPKGPRNEVVVATWTPTKILVTRRRNTNHLDDKEVPPADRADTTRASCSEPIFSSDILKALLGKIVGALVGEIEVIIEKRRVIEFEAHFKVDRQSKIWLLWVNKCSLIRQPLLLSALSAGGKFSPGDPTVSKSLGLSVLSNYHMDKKRRNNKSAVRCDSPLMDVGRQTSDASRLERSCSELPDLDSSDKVQDAGPSVTEEVTVKEKKKKKLSTQGRLRSRLKRDLRELEVVVDDRSFRLALSRGSAADQEDAACELAHTVPPNSPMDPKDSTTLSRSPKSLSKSPTVASTPSASAESAEAVPHDAIFDILAGHVYKPPERYVLQKNDPQNNYNRYTPAGSRRIAKSRSYLREQREFMHTLKDISGVLLKGSPREYGTVSHEVAEVEAQSSRTKQNVAHRMEMSGGCAQMTPVPSPQCSVHSAGDISVTNRERERLQLVDKLDKEKRDHYLRIRSLTHSVCEALVEIEYLAYSNVLSRAATPQFLFLLPKGCPAINSTDAFEIERAPVSASHKGDYSLRIKGNPSLLAVQHIMHTVKERAFSSLRKTELAVLLRDMDAPTLQSLVYHRLPGKGKKRALRNPMKDAKKGVESARLFALKQTMINYVVPERAMPAHTSAEAAAERDAFGSGNDSNSSDSSDGLQDSPRWAEWSLSLT